MGELDIREKFYQDLISSIEKREITGPILKIASPDNGKTIKINGIVLFKIIRCHNKWKEKGIVIYKHLTDSALREVNAERSNDKKKWVGCSLNKENYDKLMKILLSIIDKIKVTKPKTRIKKENKKWEKKQ